MKYIRTKDGIYEISQTYSNEKRVMFFLDNVINGVRGYAYNLPNDEIKLADTIEELCDEFVVKIKTGYLITYYDKKLLTQDANKNGADVYGAIWTNKGLIFVAKINEKGELELL